MTWHSCSYPPALSADDVHLWRVPVDQPAATLAMLQATLTPAEHCRAERFLRPLDRAHFQIGRAVLRLLLADYLQARPSEIALTYEGRGKPAVAGDVQFNVSHSGPWLLLGFTHERPIGVDVERIRPMPNAADLAQRNFAPGEWEAWRALPTNLQLDAFFRAWTRKEAFIKAVGAGLSYPLEEFEVTLRPDAAAAFVHIRNDPVAAARWSLFDLPIGAGCLAAAAVERRGVVVRRFEWRPDTCD